MATKGNPYQLLGCPDGMYITLKQIKEIKFSDTARVTEIKTPLFLIRSRRKSMMILKAGKHFQKFSSHQTNGI